MHQAPCFNPRPRRGAGATPAANPLAGFSLVSILARAEARALRIGGRDEHTASTRFNPRPRRGAGATCFCVGLRLRISVSILARAEARALLRIIARLDWVHNVSILARAEARALLNFPTCPVSGTAVSILARAEARALRRGLLVELLFLLFQSSPAPRRGRYLAP